MPNTDAVNLIAIACAGGALMIGYLVVRMPSLDESAAVKRVRRTLLGCSMLLLSVSVAFLITTDSISSLQWQLSVFNDARLRQQLEYNVRLDRVDETARALESRLKTGLDELKESVLHSSQQMYDLKMQTIRQLAIEIAETQQVVAEQAGFSRLELLVFGKHLVGFEIHAISPADYKESDDELWWVEISEFARGTEKLKNKKEGEESLSVCMKGVRSVRGHYGHMGGYKHLFLVTEVLGVGSEAGSACGQRSG